jgi:hypothetical protein
MKNLFFLVGVVLGLIFFRERKSLPVPKMPEPKSDGGHHRKLRFERLTNRGWEVVE